MPRKDKRFLCSSPTMVGGGILLLIIGFILGRFFSPQPTNQNQEVSSNTLMTTWKTYTHKSGFSFRYPPQLNPEITEGNKIVLSGNMLPENSESKFIIIVGYAYQNAFQGGIIPETNCSTDEKCFKLQYEETTRTPSKKSAIISGTVLGRQVKGIEFLPDTGKVETQLLFPFSLDDNRFLIMFEFFNYSPEEIAANRYLIDQILSTTQFTE